MDCRISKRVTGSVILIFSPTNVPARSSKNGSPLFAKRGAFSRSAALLKWRRQFCKRWLEVRRPNRSKHTPEFTMLEAYWAYADFERIANLVEELICYLAEKICGSLSIEHRDANGNVTRTIKLNRPWRRVRYRDLMREVAGKDWFELPPEQRRERAMNEFKLEILPQLADFEVTQHVFEKLIEEKTMDPLFVTHCPKELVPLAKQNAEDSSLVDVFELVINGVEIAPGYSELNDPL